MASDLQFLVPLAGLEPATCCLGDVSVYTLCSSTNFLVVSHRGVKVISSSLTGYSELACAQNQPSRAAA
jgi:hypothetical protein